MFTEIKLRTDSKKATAIDKLHCLMYSLLYPAVLGTMIVLWVIEFKHESSEFDLRFAYALFLVFYFSSQHVENALRSSYSGFTFITDLAEILCIFILFILLNFYDSPLSVINDKWTGWMYFHIVLMLAFALPVINRFTMLANEKSSGEGKNLIDQFRTGLKEKPTRLSGLAIALAAFGVIGSHLQSQLILVIILSILTGLLLSYFSIIIKR